MICDTYGVVEIIMFCGDGDINIASCASVRECVSLAVSVSESVTQGLEHFLRRALGYWMSIAHVTKIPPPTPPPTIAPTLIVWFVSYPSPL